jgi:hypothetical protein
VEDILEAAEDYRRTYGPSVPIPAQLAQMFDNSREESRDDNMYNEQDSAASQKSHSQ